MSYSSQRVAYPYFLLSALLFTLQIVFGLIIAAQYVWPQFMVDTLPFNMGKAIHINLLILWLLLGMMGATYYILPPDSRRELHSPRLAMAQFWILTVAGVADVGGLLFGVSEGRKYLEAPWPLDVMIIAGALIFLYNVGMTVWKSQRRTSIQAVLLTGLAGLSVLFLGGNILVRNPNFSIDQFWWWWIVHLWVEGTWELVVAAVTAYMLIRLTGVPREQMEKWMYLEVALVFLAGILGIGHHYYWIGTPRYWFMVGGFFSAMEPLPLALMVWNTFQHLRETRQKPANTVALYWLVAAVIGNFVGAGLMGVVHTLPIINQWTHGTQVTAGHGHMAFFGAYAAHIVAMIYYALPEMRGVTNSFNQRRGMRALWWMNLSMLAISVTLMISGVVEVYLNRISGLDFMTVKNTYMTGWMVWRLVFGFTFAIGLLYYLYDVFVIARATPAARPVGEVMPESVEV